MASSLRRKEAFNISFGNTVLILILRRAEGTELCAVVTSFGNAILILILRRAEGTEGCFLSVLKRKYIYCPILVSQQVRVPVQCTRFEKAMTLLLLLLVLVTSTVVVSPLYLLSKTAWLWPLLVPVYTGTCRWPRRRVMIYTVLLGYRSSVSIKC
jgi:hypothetical protein